MKNQLLRKVKRYIDLNLIDLACLGYYNNKSAFCKVFFNKIYIFKTDLYISYKTHE